MADGTLQSMIADRLNSNKNLQMRLRQYYLDKGYSPDIATAMATAEMYRRKPASDAGTPVAEQFYETPATVEEARRTMPMMTATIPAGPVKQLGNPEDNAEARFNQMRVINSQYKAQGLPEPYPDVPAPRPTDRSAYGTSLTSTLTQSLGLPADIQSPPWPSAAPAAPNVPPAAPTVAATEDRRSPWDETNLAAPQFQPERRSPWDETNEAAPRFTPAAPSRTRSSSSAPAAPAASAASSPETMTLSDLWKAANRPDSSSADFFRADRAMQEAIKKGQDVGYYGQAEGKKGGGAVQGKDAAIHKALEIIQHLLTRG